MYNCTINGAVQLNYYATTPVTSGTIDIYNCKFIFATIFPFKIRYEKVTLTSLKVSYVSILTTTSDWSLVVLPRIGSVTVQKFVQQISLKHSDIAGIELATQATSADPINDINYLIENCTITALSYNLITLLSSGVVSIKNSTIGAIEVDGFTGTGDCFIKNSVVTFYQNGQAAPDWTIMSSSIDGDLGGASGGAGVTYVFFAWTSTLDFLTNSAAGQTYTLAGDLNTSNLVKQGTTPNTMTNNNSYII
jgi:hypothetical protein